jgi:hypothetical protein
MRTQGSRNAYQVRRNVVVSRAFKTLMKIHIHLKIQTIITIKEQSEVQGTRLLLNL